MRDQPELPGLSSAALRLLREDQPSDLELATAYQRFVRKPRQHAPGVLVSRWLIAGLVMGLGVAFGADAVVQQLQAPTQPTRTDRPAFAAAAPRPARKAAPLSAPLSSAEQSPEPAAEPLPAVPGLKPARSFGSVSPRASVDTVGERPAADSAVWAKAAQGLRDNDFAATESALVRLEHAGSSSDREAARLIRAQLMLHQGDRSGARALLQELAQHASSAQVRAKAQQLLSDSSAQSNSALNPAPSGT